MKLSEQMNTKNQQILNALKQIKEESEFLNMIKLTETQKQNVFQKKKNSKQTEFLENQFGRQLTTNETKGFNMFGNMVKQSIIEKTMEHN